MPQRVADSSLAIRSAALQTLTCLTEPGRRGSPPGPGPSRLGARFEDDEAQTGALEVIAGGQASLACAEDDGIVGVVRVDSPGWGASRTFLPVSSSALLPGLRARSQAPAAFCLPFRSSAAADSLP